MRPKGTAAELERRRRRAVELVDQGESPTLVARILGVRPTTIHRWRRLARQEHGLDAKPLPGPTPRLAEYQLALKQAKVSRPGAVAERFCDGAPSTPCSRHEQPVLAQL